MSDVAQGAGWWIASDGKWYPPEQHPSVRAQPAPALAGYPPPVAPAPQTQQVAPSPVQNEYAGGPPGAPAGAEPPTPVPAPPPMIIPPVPSPRRADLSVAAATPGGVAGGVDLANGPALGPTARQPLAPAGGYGGQYAKLSPYDEALASGAGMVRPVRRRHFPVWWTLLIVLVLVIAAAGTIYYLRNSDPHRSATAVAEDFLVASANGDKHQVQADLLPGQHPVVVRLGPSQLSFAVTGIASSGPDRVVSLLVCTDLYAGSSCSKEIDGVMEGTIPTRKVDGKWYVDVASLLPCEANSLQVACGTP